MGFGTDDTCHPLYQSLGELLRETVEHKGGRDRKSPFQAATVVGDLPEGISRTHSSRWQQAGSLFVFKIVCGDHQQETSNPQGMYGGMGGYPPLVCPSCPLRLGMEPPPRRAGPAHHPRRGAQPLQQLRPHQHRHRTCYWPTSGDSPLNLAVAISTPSPGSHCLSTEPRHVNP